MLGRDLRDRALLALFSPSNSDKVYIKKKVMLFMILIFVAHQFET